MAFRYRIGDCGFGISGRWRPTGAVFRFFLRLSSASGEIVHSCVRGTAGGMTFVSGLSGIPGMIRDCRDGGALRAQFLILPSALICTGRIFPHLCSSPSPDAGAPLPSGAFPLSERVIRHENISSISPICALYG